MGLNDITSLEFVENIFKLMNWNRECRYKVLGRVANSDQGLCMTKDGATKLTGKGTLLRALNGFSPDFMSDGHRQ